MSFKWVLPLFLALPCIHGTALAANVLGPQLEGFAVLGGSTLTNTGLTTLIGNLGVSSGSAITGFYGTVANRGMQPLRCRKPNLHWRELAWG